MATLPDRPPLDLSGGWAFLYQMVREEDRGVVIVLASTTHDQGEEDMGLVPADLDEAFDATESGPPADGEGLLPAGEYQGVVVSAEVRDPKYKTWRDGELSIKLQVTEGEHAGKNTFCDVETAPLTNKEGASSPGKLKFLKWQLEALGYNGKLSELPGQAQNLMGAVVSFEQKIEEQDKINPKTGDKYVNREVVLKENVTPGMGSQTSELPSEPAVY